MNENSIVTGIRQKRAEILASYHGDYHAMMHDMMQRQWTSGHKVVNLARETQQPALPAKPTRRKGTKLPDTLYP